MMTSPTESERTEKRWNHVCPIMTLWARSLVGPVILPRYVQTLIVGVSLSKPLLMYALCGMAAAHLHSLRGDISMWMKNGADKPSRRQGLPLSYLIYKGKTVEGLSTVMQKKEDIEDPHVLLSLVLLLSMTVSQHFMV